MLQREPVVSERLGESREGPGRTAQRIDGRDLRSDVDVDSDEPQAGPPTVVAVDAACVGERHAKLTDPQARRDVGMAFGVNIRIDPQRDSRLDAERVCDRRDTIQLTRRFRVDRGDTVRNGVLELSARLADAGENDLGRKEPGPLRHVYLPARVRIDLAAERAQQSYDRERRVGLERVVNGVGIRGERLVERVVRGADRLGAVDIDRRADAFDDRLHTHAIAGQTIVGGLKRQVHERSHVIMRASASTFPRSTLLLMWAPPSDVG